MKRILVLAMLVLATGAAQASYLLWQVSDDRKSQFSDANVARVFAMKNDGQEGQSYVSGLKSKVGATEAEWLGIDFSDTGNWATLDLSQLNVGEGESLSNYSFYIELATYDGSEGYTFVAQSMKWENTYDKLLEKGAIVSSLTDVGSQLAMWTNASGGYTTVPEPTSGLMVIIGMALLGLRRRTA